MSKKDSRDIGLCEASFWALMWIVITIGAIKYAVV